jgi:regulator of nonsense transcripts 1
LNCSLVREEYQFEKAQIELRLKKWPKERLRAEGYALFSLVGLPKGNLFQDKVFRFQFPRNGPLPFHRFGVGDVVRVSLSGANPLDEGAVDGVLLDRRRRHVDICFKASAAEQLRIDKTYRLDNFVNRITYDRMLESLHSLLQNNNLTLSRTIRDIIIYSYPNSILRVASMPGGLRLGIPMADPVMKLTEMKIDAMNSSALLVAPSIAGLDSDELDKQSTVMATEISDNICTAEESFDDTQESLEALGLATGQTHRNAITLPVFDTNDRLRELTRYASRSLLYTKDDVQMAVALVQQDANLNPSQLEALLACIKQSLTLVQGPPGTGKTKTACAILATLVQLKEQRLRGHGQRDGLPSQKILACAHSNVATDNLLEGLLTLGVNAVRIGRPANIRTFLWNSTLDAQLHSHQLWKDARAQLDRAHLNIAAMKQSKRSIKCLDIAQRDIRSAHKLLDELESVLVNEILDQADVVVSSCIGAGADTIKGFVIDKQARFSTVLIDEAAQCMESACFPTLVHGCERLILIGDQNQLPPVITSPRALDAGLGVSLFARLCVGGIRPRLLNQQYRMHPEIAMFSSKQFYGGEVTSEVKPEDRPTPQGFDWPNREVPIAFLNVCPACADAVILDALEIPSELLGADDLENSESFASAESFYMNRARDQGFEMRSKSVNASFINQAEAAVAVSIIEELLRHGDVPGSEIGVISPYNGQVRLLIDVFRTRGWVEVLLDDRPSDVINTGHGHNQMRNMTEDLTEKEAAAQNQGANRLGMVSTELSELTAEEVSVSQDSDTLVYGPGNDETEETNQPVVNDRSEDVEVRSVDGFQGREKDVILISAVRSNNNSAIGFLKDWRRLNVAVTRARRGLIVVGDATTLSTDNHWRAFIQYCKQRRAFRDVQVPLDALGEVNKMSSPPR